MPKTYNVLWIDDECETWGADLKGDALDNDILLKGFTSVEEGFKHLREDLSRYNAILLDVISFEKKEQKKGTENERALDQARDHIMSLKHEKVFPFFVLTGQKTKHDDKSFVQRYEGQLFKKGSQDDKERLFAAIKTAVDEQPEIQLRDRYAPAFAACTPQIISEKAGRLLLETLTAIDNPQTNHRDNTDFNKLRIIIEEVFAAAYRHQLLPSQCIKPSGEVNLKNSSIFLSGRPTFISATEEVKATTPLLPSALSSAIIACLDLTSTASHGAKPNNAPAFADYRQLVGTTPYLLVALTHQVMDLLVLFKALLGDKPRLGMYQNKWKVGPKSR